MSAIVDAVGHCGVAISHAVDRLINDADNITAAIARSQRRIKHKSIDISKDGIGNTPARSHR